MVGVNVGGCDGDGVAVDGAEEAALAGEGSAVAGAAGAAGLQAASNASTSHSEDASERMRGPKRLM